MNFFQRLSYLKDWHDTNYSMYIENRKLCQEALLKKYRNELKQFNHTSKKLKKHRAIEIQKSKSLSYQEFVEKQFHTLIQKLSQTRVDFQRSELINRFEIWQKDFAHLDYKFRVFTIELYYKVKISRYIAEFDMYIEALKKSQTDWLTSEDERYKIWSENHPLYKELQELEYQYDSVSDNDAGNRNFYYNGLKTSKKLTISRNYQCQNIKSFSVSKAKPNMIESFTQSYF